MARIRTIKPEFCQSETIGKLSRDARLLFIQLWTFVDDRGRCRGSSRLLAASLYPYDPDVMPLMDGWLLELEALGCVRRYILDGDTYLDIPNWGKHQRIDNAGISRIPEYCGEPPRTAANVGDPPLYLGPRTIGPRTEREGCAKEPLVSDEAITIVDDLAKSQNSDIGSPEFIGMPMRVQSWLNEKIPRDFILTTCARLPGKHQNYLDKAVRNSWAEQQSEPKSTPRKQDGTAQKSGLAAIDRVFDRLEKNNEYRPKAIAGPDENVVLSLPARSISGS